MAKGRLNKLGSAPSTIGNQTIPAKPGKPKSVRADASGNQTGINGGNAMGKISRKPMKG